MKNYMTAQAPSTKLNQPDLQPEKCLRRNHGFDIIENGNFTVLGVFFWGFLIETLTSKVFKQPQA